MSIQAHVIIGIHVFHWGRSGKDMNFIDKRLSLVFTSCFFLSGTITSSSFIFIIFLLIGSILLSYSLAGLSFTLLAFSAYLFIIPIAFAAMHAFLDAFAARNIIITSMEIHSLSMPQWHNIIASAAMHSFLNASVARHTIFINLSLSLPPQQFMHPSSCLCGIISFSLPPRQCCPLLMPSRLDISFSQPPLLSFPPSHCLRVVISALIPRAFTVQSTI
ncbi:hypothetical protein AMECASPLE_032723 [Ameca splendens]|uniref:Uncharacterized protein n=1 Tax=Ameca splendens TaxID=208324 RepID=A0ABV1AGB8_9TELE